MSISDNWATKWIERCKRCRFAGKEGDMITCRRRGPCKFIQEAKKEETYVCKTCNQTLSVLEMRKQAYKGRIYYTMCKACYNKKARENRNRRITANEKRKVKKDN